MNNVLTSIKKSAYALFPAKWINILLNSKAGYWDQYFDDAESAMDRHWNKFIWPNIKDFDFTTILELAPGAGRNTERLSQLETVESIHAVDINASALEKCKKRMEKISYNPEICFHKTNGTSLDMIEDNSITTFYCWDSAVHFERSIFNAYMQEIQRVLKNNGKGFIHFSNMGENVSEHFQNNIAGRSNMDSNYFEKLCAENNFKILKLIEIDGQNSIKDCISVFQHKSSK